MDRIENNKSLEAMMGGVYPQEDIPQKVKFTRSERPLARELNQLLKAAFLETPKNDFSTQRTKIVTMVILAVRAAPNGESVILPALDSMLYNELKHTVHYESEEALRATCQQLAKDMATRISLHQNPGLGMMGPLEYFRAELAEHHPVPTPFVLTDEAGDAHLAPGIVSPEPMDEEKAYAIRMANKREVLEYIGENRYGRFQGYPTHKILKDVQSKLKSGGYDAKLASFPYVGFPGSSLLNNIYAHLGRDNPEIAKEHIRRDRFDAQRATFVTLFAELPRNLVLNKIDALESLYLDGVALASRKLPQEERAQAGADFKEKLTTLLADNLSLSDERTGEEKPMTVQQHHILEAQTALMKWVEDVEKGSLQRAC